MLTRLLVVALVVAVAPTQSLAGPNANTTLVLHAVQTSYGPCEIEDPCVPEPGHPTVEITEPGEAHVIYFIVRNYAEIAGVQARIEWPQDWVWLFEISGCHPGGTSCFHHGQNNVVCVHNCVTAGATVVEAAIRMIPGSGCFEILESPFLFGTSVIDCQAEWEPVAEANWGRVCVGPGGINTCEPVASPVEPTTWGMIKGQYEGRGDGDSADYPDRGYQD